MIFGIILVLFSYTLAVMKMKAYYKIYLLYTVIFLIGASLSAGIYFAYGASVFPTDAFEIGTGFNVMAFASVSSSLLSPVFLIFLCGFTVYSCFISSFICLQTGAILGRIAIKYCLSEHIFFTHGAILLILCIIASAYVIISKEASVCRSSLKSTAPDPSAILRSSFTSSYFKNFSSVIIAVITASFAFYLLLIYFPI